MTNGGSYHHGLTIRALRARLGWTQVHRVLRDLEQEGDARSAAVVVGLRELLGEWR